MRRRRTFVVFTGGLGNQLFQFAAAASVGEVDGVRVTSIRSTPQLALIDLMPKLVARSGSWDAWRLGRPFDRATGWRRVVEVVLWPLRVAVARQTVKGTAVLDHAFAPRPDRPRRPLVLDGYFQHPDWYGSVLDSLTDRVIAVAPDTRGRPHSPPKETVVVHVRGGDYRQLGWFLDVGYYERALDLLGTPGTLRVVTDDAEAASEVAALCVARGWDCSIDPEGATALDDFWCLVAATTLVMSNSTFCWWAAVIGDRQCSAQGHDRLVVFPEQWVLGNGGVLRRPTWVSA